MPRIFNDSIDQDCEDIFFNTDEFAILVSIIRGTDQTDLVPAISDSRTYDAVDEFGISLAWLSVDFDIIAKHYLIRGVQVEPRHRDRIVQDDGSIFEVVPLPNKHVFEPTGGDGKVFRIHTQRIN